jgi:acyl transferase domain-containing protein
MMLKSLEDALLDGDPVRAVIRGTGTNQDGKTPGIVQPNSEAQATLIRSTYEAAGLLYCDTHYFEAHGTGTRVGDPLELGALASAFGAEKKMHSRPLYVGSVKTNIGHLEGGAGLAGLLKTILCLERGVIVPHINFKTPNPELRLNEWNFTVPTKLIPWPCQGLRRASINSFGYGGSNAHCIVDDAHHYLKLRDLRGNTATVSKCLSIELEEGNFDSALGSSGDVSPISPPEGASHQQPMLFVLSSPEQAALQRVATQYAQYLESRKKNMFSENEFLRNLAFTLSSRRSVLQWKTAVVAASMDELIQNLEKVGPSYRATAKSGIIYVFTSQGAQWYAMGRELQRYERFMQSMEEADRYIASLGAKWSVKEELNAPEELSKVDFAKYSQPLCTVLQIALVDLLASWQVIPVAVCGHSSGEIGEFCE